MHLEPLGENEGDKVAKVHGLTAGPAPRVQEELLSLLHMVQDHLQATV